MHPSPGRPAADHNADQEQRRDEEDAGAKHTIDPAPDEETAQRRRDDDPAEHADLTNETQRRRLALAARQFLPGPSLADRFGQAIRSRVVHRMRSDQEPPSIVPRRSGRRY